MFNNAEISLNLKGSVNLLSVEHLSSTHFHHTHEDLNPLCARIFTAFFVSFQSDLI